MNQNDKEILKRSIIVLKNELKKQEFNTVGEGMIAEAIQTIDEILELPQPVRSR